MEFDSIGEIPSQEMADETLVGCLQLYIKFYKKIKKCVDTLNIRLFFKFFK
jgi:translation initiation factor 2 beta subunit (eIF-2beta)/eIF-5